MSLEEEEEEEEVEEVVRGEVESLVGPVDGVSLEEEEEVVEEVEEVVEGEVEPLVGPVDGVSLEEEEVEEVEVEEVVDGGSVGGSVVLPQHGAVKGLNRLSWPPWQRSPAIFL